MGTVLNARDGEGRGKRERGSIVGGVFNARVGGGVSVVGIPQGEGGGGAEDRGFLMEAFSAGETGGKVLRIFDCLTKES